MGVNGPDYLTSLEVAAMFRVDQTTAVKWGRRWLESGEVKVIRTPGGQYRFWAADIRALLAAQASRPARGPGRD